MSISKNERNAIITIVAVFGTLLLLFKFPDFLIFKWLITAVTFVVEHMLWFALGLIVLYFIMAFTSEKKADKSTLEYFIVLAIILVALWYIKEAWVALLILGLWTLYRIFKKM
jgi:hypothetical protein